MAEAVEQNLDQLVAAAVEKKLAENDAKRLQEQGLQVEEDKTPQPIRVNVGGQVYEFPNEAAVSEKFAELQRGRDEAAEIAARTAAAAGQKQQNTREEIKGLDVNKFLETLATNPEAAFDMVDEKRFGFAQAPAVLKAALMKTASMEREMASNAFKDRHPEYIADEQNAQALVSVMNQFNIGWTPQGLELAYAQGRMAGIIRYDEDQTQNNPWSEKQVSNFQQDTRKKAPPSAGRSSSLQAEGQIAQSVLDRAEELSADELQELIQSYERKR